MDRVLQGWEAYMIGQHHQQRPIATIGSSTPNLGGDFWISQFDKWTHLLLPTIALVLISFAGYTRYQRGSMLEVMDQDYIRTARSKGMSERIVLIRHALRNALLPLASIVPVDFITLIGGAVITETIFNWAGMGRLFVTSLANSEIDPDHGLHHDHRRAGDDRQSGGRLRLRHSRPTDQGERMSTNDFPDGDRPEHDPESYSERASKPVETGDMVSPDTVMSDRSAIETDPLSTFPDGDGRRLDVDLDEAAATGRGEGVGQAKEVEGLSQGQIVWSRFIRHRGAMFGVATLALIALLSYHRHGHRAASRAGGITRVTPTAVRSSTAGPRPCPGAFSLGEHPFGQDDIGRDNFAMVLSGVQTSLLVMTVLGLIALLLGTSGWFAGRATTAARPIPS